MKLDEQGLLFFVAYLHLAFSSVINNKEQVIRCFFDNFFTFFNPDSTVHRFLKCFIISLYFVTTNKIISNELCLTKYWDVIREEALVMKTTPNVVF